MLIVNIVRAVGPLACSDSAVVGPGGRDQAILQFNMSVLALTIVRQLP